MLQEEEWPSKSAEFTVIWMCRACLHFRLGIEVNSCHLSNGLMSIYLSKARLREVSVVVLNNCNLIALDSVKGDERVGCPVAQRSSGQEMTAIGSDAHDGIGNNHLPCRICRSRTAENSQDVKVLSLGDPHR